MATIIDNRITEVEWMRRGCRRATVKYATRVVN